MFFFSAELKRYSSKHFTGTSKIVTNPRKQTKPQSMKHIATASAAKSTTATKVTKLVLKPKTTPKNSPVTKMTTKKYSTKPVTVKSRSTLSTMVSHESTFRVQNIKKTSSNAKYGIKQSAISVKSEQISHQLTMNTNIFDTNQMIDTNKSTDIVLSEQNGNITSFNITKNMSSPILQEITSAVVNGSNILNKITNDFDVNSFEKVKDHENYPPKTITHCENDVNCQKKKYDVNKARKFIQMQREKWKEAEKLEKVKSKPPATKDEIKERLNALKQNTLNIVAKNVQKARNNSVQCTNSKNITRKKTVVPSKKLIGKFIGQFL